MCNFHFHNLRILLYKLFSLVNSFQQKRMSTNLFLLASFNFNGFFPHFIQSVDKQQICYLFDFLLFPYFTLLSATLFIFLSRTTSSVQSHIILIYDIYSIIDIPLNTSQSNIRIYSIINIISTISIS